MRTVLRTGLSVIVLICIASCTKTAKLASSRAPIFARANKYVKEGNSDAVASCMRRAGFSYISFFGTGEAAPINPLGEPARKLTSYGLRAVASSNRFVSADPNVSIRNTLSSADQQQYDLALFGKDGRRIGTGSCIAQGFDEAAKRSANIRTAAAHLRSEFDSTEPVKRYREKWMLCMKRAGYSYERRTDLIIGMLNTYFNFDELEAAEKAAVKEDRRCISNTEEQDFQSLAAKYESQIMLDFLNK